MDMNDRIVLTEEHDTKSADYHRLGLADLGNKFATSPMTVVFRQNFLIKSPHFWKKKNSTKMN